MSEKEWSCQNCGHNFSVLSEYHNQCMLSPKPMVMKCTHCGAADSFPVDVALGREAAPSWMRLGTGDIRNAKQDYDAQAKQYLVAERRNLSAPKKKSPWKNRIIDIFRPDWEHSDWQVRLKAVGELRKRPWLTDNTTDEERRRSEVVLKKIIRKEANETVFREAVTQLCKFYDYSRPESKPPFKKVACTNCGVWILSITAEENSGLCAVCVRGMDIKNVRRIMWELVKARPTHATVEPLLIALEKAVGGGDIRNADEDENRNTASLTETVKERKERAKSIVYCDGHSDLWGKEAEQQIDKREGYLVSQKVIFEKEREQISKGSNSYGISGMSIAAVSRTESLYQARQGSTDWLLCEKCIHRRGIHGAERRSARRRAEAWWAKRLRGS